MLRLIISPAKKMVAEAPLPSLATPRFAADAQALTGLLRSLPAEKLQHLWRTSDALTAQCLRTLETWQPSGPASPPALLAYQGIQYARMAPAVMTQRQLDYLQDHLRILSGLYGLLRPFDGVCPYRLEMGAKFPEPLCTGAQGFPVRDLYDYWGDRLAKALVQEGTNVLVNIASVEYAKAVCSNTHGYEVLKNHGVPVVTCLFGAEKSGRWAQRATAAKEARGTFVRWCAEHEVCDAEELLSFNEAGYCLDKERSEPESRLFVFTRF